jgi:hypothetical protein
MSDPHRASRRPANSRVLSTNLRPAFQAPHRHSQFAGQLLGSVRNPGFQHASRITLKLFVKAPATFTLWFLIVSLHGSGLAYTWPQDRRHPNFWFVTAAIHNLRLRAPPLASPQIEFAPPIFTSVGRCVERAVWSWHFIVTAAGNNFGNLPSRNIVYPARFKRWWRVVG